MNIDIKSEIENLTNNDYGDLYAKTKLYNPISQMEEKWKLVIKKLAIIIYLKWCFQMQSQIKI